MPLSNRVQVSICIYYPNLVILPVDNNEHQRIDDVSTDRISYDIRSVETMGFALWRMNCSIVVPKRNNKRASLVQLFKIKLD